MAKKQKDVKVPNLRFPGFEGEWARFRFHEIVRMMSGGTPSMQRDDYWNGNIPFISAAAMHDTFISTSTQYISEAGLKNGSKLLKKGNLLLLVRGSMLWKQIPICYNSVDIAFNQDVKGLIPNDKTTAKFILYWLQSKEQLLKNKVTGTGIGAGKLDSSEISNLSVSLPEKSEQLKIAEIFSALDNRIHTQSKIIEKLETLIKEIRDQLFDQKLRFAKFNEKWKKYRVSDLLEFFPTNSLSWENLEYEDGNLINLHYGLIHKDAPLTIDVTYYALPNIKANATPKNYVLCQDGDIVFADASEDTNDVAKAVEFVKCNDKKIVCGLHTIHGRDKLNVTIPGFKANLFNATNFHHQIRQLAQGTKVFSISAKTFNECFIQIPSEKEQYKIVDLLSTMNSQLFVQKRLLKNYISQKKHLLSKLFI